MLDPKSNIRSQPNSFVCIRSTNWYSYMRGADFPHIWIKVASKLNSIMH